MQIETDASSSATRVSDKLLGKIGVASSLNSLLWLRRGVGAPFTRHSDIFWRMWPIPNSATCVTPVSFTRQLRMQSEFVYLCYLSVFECSHACSQIQ